LKNDHEPLFELNHFEHGAGGSLGALLYSGLPFANPGMAEKSIGGFLRIWMGGLGTGILMTGILIASICTHFSLKPFSVLMKFIKTPRLRKADPVSEVNTKAKSTPRDTIEPKSKSPKKWKFPWSFSEPDDDLLFGDVSERNNAEIEASMGKPKVLKGTIEKKKIIEKQKDELSAKDPADEVEAKIEKANPGESPADEPAKQLEEEDPAEPVSMDGFKVVRAAKTEKAADLFPERKGDYHFPTLDLLMDPPEEESSGDEDHMIKAKRLKETLSEFKIEIELGEVHTGPVITRYDVHPAAGVRVEKIANLDKNLAMALKADSVRILAPVPGKGCVGIEVPNAKPAAVCLKEILQSRAWADAGSEIPIVLGKEASGRPLVADLTKMPHLLVAGSTGSGKTVCINAIIASLCYHSSPEDVRFIMVDPKIVEMKVYNDLPHMLIPVVTEPKKVPGALKWLLVEMERRYQIFSKVGVRNVAGFNAKILKDKEEKEKAQLLDAEMTPEERAALSTIQVPRDDDALEIPENKLPYIVCIIDELADLMMVAQADVETGIARLAQLARAAGIHLIIATQRPSVNVITGVIKANLPSRISFRVASYRDSQTILDGKGAEALIGRGDMLFIPPGSSTFARAQGAFVSDEEINGIVDYLKINGPPQIIEEVREQIESAGEDDVLGDGDSDSDEDPMVKKAIEIIRSTKRASTSNLQRKLSIGYNRAARIMDDLEDRGLVGPDTPGQGREILMDL
jgi:S-DNA-T family DNA segregation ATPase FtsK/SpoIIIE